jgi:hypothetical protein
VIAHEIIKMVTQQAACYHSVCICAHMCSAHQIAPVFAPRVGKLSSVGKQPPQAPSRSCLPVPPGQRAGETHCQEHLEVKIKITMTLDMIAHKPVDVTNKESLVPGTGGTLVLDLSVKSQCPSMTNKCMCKQCVAGRPCWSSG